MKKKTILLSLLSLSMLVACGGKTSDNSVTSVFTGSDSTSNSTSSDEDYTITEGTDGIIYDLNEERNGYVVTEYLSIETDIVIPELYYGEGGLLPVREIGEEAFLYADIDSLVLPRSLRKIASRAFHGITSTSLLTSLVIPEGVEEIGEEAFEWCPSLTNVTLPSTIKYIGAKAFHLCSNLSKIYMAENDYYTVDRNVLFNKDMTLLHTYPQGIKLASYDMPNTVETVGAYAFYGNRQLARLSLSQSLKTIESHGLAALFALTSLSFDRTQIETLEDGALSENIAVAVIRLPDTLKNLGKNVFYKNSSLTSVTLNSDFEEIPDGTFKDCTNLASFTLPNGVKRIGKEAFASCNKLTSVNNITDGLEEIGERAFQADSKLSRITLPSTLKTISTDAFSYCTTLSGLVFPTELESIGNRAFTGCTAITSIDLSNTKVVSIGDYAFQFCSGIREVKFPNTLRSVGESVFERNTSLTEIAFNDGLETIGDKALVDCSSLLKVFIPASVQEIGRSAFLNKFRTENDPDLIICFEAESFSGSLNYSEAKTHLEFGVTREAYEAK